MWYVLAQLVPDGIGNLSPYAALGANGILVALAVWLITKHMPAREKEERDSRESMNSVFAKELAKTRDEFTKELGAHRLQSREIALSGHQTVERLSQRIETSFHDLAIAITELGAGSMSNSGVLRSRERDQKSIHE